VSEFQEPISIDLTVRAMHDPALTNSKLRIIARPRLIADTANNLGRGKMKPISFATTCIAIFCSMLSTTQVRAQEVCTGILTHLGRDITNESRRNAIARSVYDEYCEKNSIKQNRTTTVGLEAVVESIPLKFNLGVGSNEDKLKNFCKIYDERFASSAIEDIDKSIVVREALNAFNECITLSKKDVYFYPSIGRSMVTVSVRRGPPDVDVLGVIYEPALLNCMVPFSNDSSTTVKADQNTKKKLDGGFYPVTCVRQSKLENGITFFSRAEVTILTSQGNFILPIEADQILPLQSAQDIKSQLENANAQIAELRSRTPRLECKTKEGNIDNGLSQAALSPDEVKMGYQVTGGGCETGKTTMQLWYSGQDSPNRWICRITHLPGASDTGTIKASVQYCRYVQ
jgi:hypothetical protein